MSKKIFTPKDEWDDDQKRKQEQYGMLDLIIETLMEYEKRLDETVDRLEQQVIEFQRFLNGLPSPASLFTSHETMKSRKTYKDDKRKTRR